MADTTPDSFPRASARTQRFTRGAPRSLHLDPTGARLLFLRSRTAPTRSARCGRWTSRPATRRCSPTRAPCWPTATSSCPPAERARRERSREGGGGIVGFATDRRRHRGGLRAVQPAVGGRPAQPAAPASCRPSAPVIDPRPDPTGTLGGLRRRRRRCTSCGADGAGARTLAAAEKRRRRLGRGRVRRRRGDGPLPRLLVGARTASAVLAARVDESPVQRWYIADPAQPAPPATEVRYPAAGSANAEVTLHLLGLDGSRTDVDVGPRRPSPTSCAPRGRRPAPSLQVMSRDQQRALGARGRPGDRRDVDAGRAVGPGLARRRRRRTRPAARRPARHHRRARRRPAAGRRRRAGHRHRRPGRRGRSRSTTTACCSPAPTTRSRRTSGAGRPDGGCERLTGPGGYHTGAGRGRHRGRRQPAAPATPLPVVDGPPRRARAARGRHVVRRDSRR